MKLSNEQFNELIDEIKELKEKKSEQKSLLSHPNTPLWIGTLIAVLTFIWTLFNIYGQLVSNYTEIKDAAKTSMNRMDNIEAIVHETSTNLAVLTQEMHVDANKTIALPSRTIDKDLDILIDFIPENMNTQFVESLTY